MTYHPIPLAQARQWLRLRFGMTRMPANVQAWYVEGIQHSHRIPGLYLIASDCGMCGVYICEVKERAA